MNFKSIASNAVFATAIIAGGTVAALPSQAASFVGSQLDINGRARFDTTTGLLNFFKNDSTPGPNTGIGKIAASSAPFYDPFEGTSLTFQDLTLTSGSGGDTWLLTSPKTLFSGTVGGKALSYTLSSFTLKRGTDLFSNYPTWQGLFTGVYNYDGNSYASMDNKIDFEVIQDSQLTQVLGASYLISGTPVPTPALLPGLLAMGMGMLRKRKEVVAEEVESNT